MKNYTHAGFFAVLLLLETLFVGPLLGAEHSSAAQRIKKNVKYLSSDELRGRAPGSLGERLATSFLVEQYKKIGFLPANPDGSFLQKVPLIGMLLKNDPRLEIKGAGGEWSLEYGSQFVAWTLRKLEEVGLKDAELVFVGYGIVAPEFNWDDYKDYDVSGKVIVMLVGDPPLPDSTLFDGKAMTYYGRWTYKYEIAAKKKAAGAIIIHNTKAAGYPWAVVTNSWSGEQFDIVRPNHGMDRCSVEAWITEEVAKDLFKKCGMTLEQVEEKSLSKNFKPIDFGAKMSISLENQFRNVLSHNVTAVLPGNDLERKKEVIIYTAHWDHLGIGKPVAGDSIYNGALDNASGVAGLLEMARMFGARKSDLKRSILFINTTAEESGLLGSQYYVDHPIYPLEKTVAIMNLDGINIWGKTRDMTVVGEGYSTLDSYLSKVLKQQNRSISPDSYPEKGFYFRSDHFPFAKKGVPALYAGAGMQFAGKPAGWGRKIKEDYIKEKYHKPLDEFSPSWNLEGALEDLEALFSVGFELARVNDFPEWTEKSPFKKLRETSMERGGK